MIHLIKAKQLLTSLFATIYNLYQNDEKPFKDDQHHQDVKKISPKSRFDWLDGYRGSLAIIVTYGHTILPNRPLQCDFLNPINSQKYSIAGFFMLSSFLLTYRLLVELSKTKTNREILLVVLKYAIRRFFRIYVVYICFAFSAKYGPTFIGGYTAASFMSSIDLITLNNPGINHLWTIPPEIKYYFIIPIFCLMANVLNKFTMLVMLAICMCTSIYDQFYNVLGLKYEEITSDSKQSHQLSSHIAVFILGSQVALAYFWIERNQRQHLLQLIRSNETLRERINWVACFLVLACFRLEAHEYFSGNSESFTLRSRSTIYWASVLFLTLIADSTNLIARFFGTNRFLKSCGKYSFGIYLFTPGAITFVQRVLVKFTPIDITIGCILCAYFVGLNWFYLVEQPLIKVANELCEKVEAHEFFRRKETTWEGGDVYVEHVDKEKLKIVHDV